MTGPSPGFGGEEASSSSQRSHYGNASVEEDFDGDDRADLAFDNALLPDDPLDGKAANASYGLF